METERKKLPGVLLLLLSTLGFLIGLAVGLLTLLKSPTYSNGSALPVSEILPVLSSGILSLVVSLLNLPALLLSIRYLRGKSITTRYASLFKPATFFLVFWVLVIGAGYLATQLSQTAPILAVLTVIAVLIPVWWLVEFSRRRLPRSLALREWGTLAVGLSVTPVVIMLIEILLVILIGIAVFFALSTQPDAMVQLNNIFKNIEFYQGSMERMEEVLYELSQNPLVAGALFLVVGLVAPFIEELFKPMAIWFLLNRPLRDNEGFSLGLISGGAFALLESAGLIGQINTDTWLTAVLLRAATGLLHIGLSGMVGYGLVRSWNHKPFAKALLYLLAAGSLHGAWNSLALLSGFTTSALPATPGGFQLSLGSILPLAGMLIIFAVVLFIVLRINRNLHQHINNELNVATESIPLEK